jgi:hypothetical protein
MRKTVNVLVIAGSFLLVAAIPKVANAQSKTIPIGVKVEAEGGTTSRGMWTQSANDLTPNELGTLKRLIVQRLSERPGVRIVPLSYKENFVGIAVVAAKLPGSNAGTWYLASSVIVVSHQDGSDGFVTHDVLAGSSEESIARSIEAQFAAARLAAELGVSK